MHNFMMSDYVSLILPKLASTHFLYDHSFSAGLFLSRKSREWTSEMSPVFHPEIFSRGGGAIKNFLSSRGLI